MLEYSDGSQFGFTAEAHSTWLVRCGGYPSSPGWCDWLGVKCEGGPTPIGHQQLRIEVTCAIWRRTHPSPSSAIYGWELKWHVQCGGGPTPPLAIISWELKLHVQCGGGPTPLAINSWEFKWHMQCGGGPTPPLAISSWELKWHVWCGGGPTNPPLSTNIILQYQHTETPGVWLVSSF